MSVRLTGNTALGPAAPAFPYGSTYTICGWVKLVVQDSGAQVFVADSDGWNDYDLVFTDGLSFEAEVDGSGGSFSTPAPQMNEWHHVAMVRVSDAQALFYCDSELGRTVNMSVLGRATAGLIHLKAAWDEVVDFAQVRMWTAALSQEQLAAEMATNSPVVTANLWANWSLATADDLEDSSGNGRHLGLLSGSGISTSDNPPSADPEPSAGGGTLTPTTWANKWALEALTI